MSADDLLSAEERAILAAGATEEPAEPEAIAPAETVAEATDAVDAAPAAEADERAEAAPVFVPQFPAEEVPASRLADLRKQGIDLRKRWSNGEMDDEEYNAQA